MILEIRVVSAISTKTIDASITLCPSLDIIFSEFSRHSNIPLIWRDGGFVIDCKESLATINTFDDEVREKIFYFLKSEKAISVLDQFWNQITNLQSIVVER